MDPILLALAVVFTSVGAFGLWNRDALARWLIERFFEGRRDFFGNPIDHCDDDLDDWRRPHDIDVPDHHYYHRDHYHCRHCGRHHCECHPSTHSGCS